MKNEHNESTKIIWGLLLGSVIGAGAFYCIKSVQNRRTPVLKKIGRSIAEVGQFIESCDTPTDIMETVEKKLPDSVDVINHVTDWVESGITLWKKFKGG